jgi:hypothetical protein
MKKNEIFANSAYAYPEEIQLREDLNNIKKTENGELNSEKSSIKSVSDDGEKKSEIDLNRFFLYHTNDLEAEVQMLKDKIKLLEEKIFNSQITTSNLLSDDSKIDILKKTFIFWSKQIGINCYSKIFYYKNIFAKIFWILILLGSLSVTAWIMSWSIQDYLAYDVVSRIRIIYEKPAEFPAVTICDNNQFTTEKGLDLVNVFYNSITCQNPLYSNLSRQLECSKTLAAGVVTDPLYRYEYTKHLGLNLNQISCVYNNVNCTDDMRWLWQFDYGNCYQFNVDQNRTFMANAEGIDYGLSMSISNFTNLKIKKLGTYEGLGMKVFVHNRTSRPRWYSEGVYVKPGEYSMISVRRKFVSHQPTPYSGCINLESYSSVFYDFIRKSNRIYRQKDCFDLCIQNLAITQCGCYIKAYENPFSNLSTIRECFDISDFECFYEEYFKFDSSKCAANYCPQECDTVEYELSVSSLLYPTLNDYNSLNMTISFEEWRTQFVNLIVYYPHLEYTFIHETPAMNLASLIASLGGTMGLIVSASFFTLVEICELFVLLLHGLIFG